jgi:hypothetical protein
MKKTAGRLLYCFTTAIIVLCSCNTADSTEKQEITDNVHFQNRLTLSGSSLFIPPEWSYHSAEENDSPGILYHFADNSGTISGTVEKIDFSFTPSLEKLAQYYSSNFLTDFTNIEITSRKINNRKFYFITGKDTANNKLFLTGLTKSMNNTVFLVEIQSNGENLSDNQAVKSIFENMQFDTEISREFRILNNNIKFYCHNHSWAWLDDCNNGFYLYSTHGSQKCIVGLWETEFANTKEMFSITGNFDIDMFDAGFFINNRFIKTRGTGYLEQNGFTKLYYTADFCGKKYCIYISIPADSVSDYTEFHKSELITNLFKYNLIFSTDNIKINDDSIRSDYIDAINMDESKPNISIASFETSENDNRLISFGRTMKDSMYYILRFMGKYNVSNEDVVCSGMEETEEYADENNKDNVISGRIIKNDNEQITIEVSVYDHEKQSITITEEVTVNSIFDIFDAGDELVLEIAKGLSGIHIGYGTIILSNKGTDGNFKVFVDNKELGENLAVIDKMFYGSHLIRIEQERIFGTFIVKEEYIDVPEDEEIIFEFSVPDITNGEVAELTNMDDILFTGLNYYNSSDVRDVFNSAFKLFEDISSSSYLTVLKDKYDILWELYKEINNSEGIISDRHIYPEESALHIDYLSDSEKFSFEHQPVNDFAVFTEKLKTKLDYSIFLALSENTYTRDPGIIMNFAKPYLDDISERDPDFFDDFNNPESGWETGEFNEEKRRGKIGYDNGVYFLETYPDPEESVIISNNTNSGSYSNFILTYDLQYILFDAGIGIGFRKGNNDGYQFSFSQDSRLNIFYGSRRFEPPMPRLAPPFALESIDPLEKNNLMLIVDEYDVAVIINNEPVYYFNYEESGFRINTSPLSIIIDSWNGKTSRAHIDNFKIWSLDK